MRLSLLTGLLAVSAVLATTTRAERVILTDLSGQVYLAQQRQVVSPTTPEFAMPTQVKSRIGPSFDCMKAVDPLSSLVCGNDQLAKIDLSFNQTYQALRQQDGESGQQRLRQEAVDFQKQVYATCGLPRASAIPSASVSMASMCVARAYENQRLAWSKRLGPAALAEATRPLEQHIQLQKNLQQLGFISLLARIDGVYGASTRDAIRTWQTSNGIEPTGLLSADDAQRLAGSSTTQQSANPESAQQEEIKVLRQQVETLKAQAAETERAKQAQVARAEQAAKAEQVARAEQAAKAEQAAHAERVQVEQAQRSSPNHDGEYRLSDSNVQEDTIRQACEKINNITVSAIRVLGVNGHKDFSDVADANGVNIIEHWVNTWGSGASHRCIFGLETRGIVNGTSRRLQANCIVSSYIKKGEDYMISYCE